MTRIVSRPLRPLVGTLLTAVAIVLPGGVRESSAAPPIPAQPPRETLVPEDGPANVPDAGRPTQPGRPVAVEPAPESPRKPLTAPVGRGGSPLDAELLNRLLGRSTGPATSGEDPLDKTVRSMRSAGDRLGRRESGSETRNLQEEALREIDRLIELAKQKQNAPPQNPPPDSDPMQQTGQPRDRQQSQDSQASRTQQSQPMPQPREGATAEQRRTEDKAAESSESQDPAAKQAADEARRREDLVKDVWGHLPPSLRQELLNVYSEKYLPKYEDLVRRYFEALAEQGRRR